MKIWPFIAAALVGCGDGSIAPGRDAQKVVQRALIQAKPGDVVLLRSGTFDFTRTLSLAVEGVTIRGAGSNRTILRFANQTTGSGGEGVLVTKGGFTIEDLAIEDPRGDALKVTGADGVTIRRVRVEWTGGPSSDNGAYGLYPVESRNVLIEECEAIGASDAGIYVGQCENAIVRNNVARQNVAGIEIENTIGADVYGNTTEDNTGGMLVFTLPNLPKKEGRQCRVFGNEIRANNRENFARPGQMAGNIPPGVRTARHCSRRCRDFRERVRGQSDGERSRAEFPDDRPEVEGSVLRPLLRGHPHPRQSLRWRRHEPCGRSGRPA